VWRGYGNIKKQTNTNKYTHRDAHKIQVTNMNEFEEPEVGMVMFFISASPIRWLTDLLQINRNKKILVVSGGDIGI
jgi:hypothetical protein